MQAVLDGENVLAVMPTGSGKSLCYQLPALARPGLTLVVSPLIALMRDQVRALSAAGVAAGSLNSSNEPAENARVLGLLRRRELRLLYLAPERLARPDTVEMLCESDVRLDGDRRGALRLAMGPRLPARVSDARQPRAPDRRPAADHGADRDRRCADARRHRRQAVRRAAARLRAQLRPAEPAARLQAQGALVAPGAGLRARAMRATAASSIAPRAARSRSWPTTLRGRRRRRAALSRRPRQGACATPTRTPSSRRTAW